MLILKLFLDQLYSKRQDAQQHLDELIRCSKLDKSPCCDSMRSDDHLRIEDARTSLQSINNLIENYLEIHGK